MACWVLASVYWRECCGMMVWVKCAVKCLLEGMQVKLWQDIMGAVCCEVFVGGNACSLKTFV